MQSYVNNNKVFNNTNIKRTNDVAFKGNLATKAADVATAAIKHVENGGIVVDFLAVDFLGCVVPRIYQGYNRNKEELGHPNYKAAIEEAIRELTSGPGLIIIPALFMLLSKKVLGPASNLQFKTLKSLTGSFRSLLGKGTANLANNAKLRNDFYRNTLQEAFAEHKKMKLPSANIDQKIEEIIKKINAAEQYKSKRLILPEPNPHITDIKKIVSALNKSHSLHLDNSYNVTMKDGLTKGISDLVPDMIAYGKDVVAKVSEKSASGVTKSELPKVLDEIHNFKTRGRKLNLASIFLSSSGFLYLVPKLYQRNKNYPGLEGLNCNCPENKDKPHCKNQLPEQKNTQTPCAPTQNIQNIKPAVSFSGNPNNKKLMQNSSNPVSFGSSSFADKVFISNDFNRISPPHAVLGAYMAEVVATRLYKSRDENETRDVLTRDIPSVTTIILALPTFRNAISTLANKIFGFPISKKIESTLGHLNPKNHPFSFENIDDIYSGIDKYKNNIVDFSKNIDNNGGDLRKVLDFLSDDSKAAINNIAKQTGKNNTAVESNRLASMITNSFKAGKSKLVIPSSNKEIIAMFEKAQNNPALRNNLKTVINEMSKQGNHLVKFSYALKSVPEVASIIAISAFMGSFLPWLNTQNTKKHVKHLQEAQNNETVPPETGINRFAGKVHNMLHGPKSNTANQG